MKLGISGYFGRMGQEIISCIESNSLESSNPAINFIIDCGIVEANEKRTCKHTLATYTELGSRELGVIIDFSAPAGTEKVLSAAKNNLTPILIGTTGFSKTEIAYITEASKFIPIVLAPNTSIGVNILLEAVNLVSNVVPSSWDVELVEMHHRKKKDAPSGTAVAILQEVLDHRNGTIVSGRNAIRAPDEIGAFGVRGGSVVGEHTLYFLGEGERIELTHRANDRKIFAQGAILAAKWLVNPNLKPSIYSMRDVLFQTINP